MSSTGLPPRYLPGTQPSTAAALKNRSPRSKEQHLVHPAQMSAAKDSLSLEEKNHSAQSASFGDRFASAINQFTSLFSPSKENPPKNINVEQLHERVKQHDPAVTFVPKDPSKSIEILPGNGHTLFTHDLYDIAATKPQTAVLLLTQHADGSYTATIMNGDSENTPQEIQALLSHHNEKQAVQHTLLVAAPGYFDKNPEATGWKLQLQNPERVKQLSELVREQVGKPKAEMIEKVQLYNPQPLTAKSKALIVSFPEQAGESIRYEVCGQAIK